MKEREGERGKEEGGGRRREERKRQRDRERGSDSPLFLGYFLAFLS